MVLGLGFLLSACNRDDPTVTASSSSSGEIIAGSSSSVDSTVITNDDLPKAATTYKDKNGNTCQLTRSQLYQNAGAPHVNSHPDTGKKQKLLVAPIKFTKNEDDPNDTINANDDLLEHIRITFAGTDEEIKAAGGNISVQSFYEQSSYGYGAFDVVVLPTWIDFGQTALEFYDEAKGQAGVTAAEKVRTWYIAEYAKEGHGSLGENASSLDDLDSDDDGYIDLIWNVYAYPYTSNDTSFWWAYVTYTGNQPGSVTRPTVQTLAWASTNFMTEAAGGYESRTFIHETGHTLGQDDYYDYNKTWCPAGGIDYMDQNLGDHNSYSKFSYGWTSPWVLKEEDLEGGKTAEITLRSASITGDCLLLASPNYNNTAFDEYLMVELVGPYGLCEYDYKNKGGFTRPGIRVWHVDARAYKSNYLDEEVFSTPDEVGQNAIDLRNDNSYFGRGGDGDYFVPSSGIKRSYAQLTMLEAGFEEGSTILDKATATADNSSLFQKNGTFSLKGERGNGDGRAKVYMPSQSNLWNKAKKITGGSKQNQEYTVDDSVACNYTFRVYDIKTDADYGAVATIRVSLVD